MYLHEKSLLIYIHILVGYLVGMCSAKQCYRWRGANRSVFSSFERQAYRPILQPIRYCGRQALVGRVDRKQSQCG
ncbi:hypothetical protein EZS27_039967, partial [termite gut metagenome]